MPVGPYSTFSDCVTAFQKKGKSADAAKAICGKMEQQSASTTAAATIQEGNNNRLFVKAFLIDDSLNINRWRVSKESIDKNINSFIGKPLILYLNAHKEFDHPAPAQGQFETLNHWLSYQETFRIGSIIDIVTKPHPSIPNARTYHAIIEVTHPDAKTSLRDNKVPVYVSPAIAEFVHPKAGGDNKAPQAAAIVDPESGGALVNEWTGVHLAIVNEPAFGVKKATISASCGGSEESCLLQLRQAMVARNGVGKCGFCVKKALADYVLLSGLTAKASNITTAKDVPSTYTSQFNSATPKPLENRIMSQLESTDSTVTATQAGNSIAGESSTSKPEVVEQQRTISNPVQKSPIQTPYSTADLTQINANLKAENELLRAKVEELSNVKDTISERIAAMEMERRREKIERIITPDIIKDDKQRIEKIKYFVSTTIPVEQIDELYKDIRVTLRKASANQVPRGGRVHYGVSQGSGNVTVSSSSANDDDGGSSDQLTPLQKQLMVLRGVR